MSQPVKVSDALVLDARLTGEATQRSIAGQIEFWARLGRSIETLLRGDQLLALAVGESGLVAGFSIAGFPGIHQNVRSTHHFPAVCGELQDFRKMEILFSVLRRVLQDGQQT